MRRALRPDLTLLRELVEDSPELGRRPTRPAPEQWLRDAEARIGTALPPSYRWWLAEYGRGRTLGADIATVVPPEYAEDVHEAVSAPWRRSADRLRFAGEPDGGNEYHFALDRTGEAGAGEFPVVRRDGLDGEEYPEAESFAGFLAVHQARSRGLGDGPNPTVARLWRSTPGVLLDSGVLVYGPHGIRERNETFEVARYAPEWVLIGDDSGGTGLFMRRHGRDRTRVYRLGLGAIDENVETEGELVTDDLLTWLEEAGAAG
ncbi:SMI1/KNR4 family protein [Kitasatospora sp. NPDC002965]|uniref:SMI1/KNR4 family protein n=1 Tax=Kitasatospora sp. NPDC002965 TaxID=3154775 RepID=UPI0033AB8CD2